MFTFRLSVYELQAKAAKVTKPTADERLIVTTPTAVLSILATGYVTGSLKSNLGEATTV
jgi:hypothetical protein